MSPGGVTVFSENLLWVELWKQLQFVVLLGILHWQGMRVNAAVLVGLGHMATASVKDLHSDSA